MDDFFNSLLVDVRDVELLRDILTSGWLAPLDDDRLYEIYVLVRVLRALEQVVCSNDMERVEYTVMAVAESAIATFHGEDWTATVCFDTAPHNSFRAIFDERDYRYTNILDQYGTGIAAARRPDISIELRRNSDGAVRALLVEVKHAPLASQYGRDSVYKVLGYLSDFEKLWSEDFADVRPKISLVLSDGVVPEDYMTSLDNDVVLFSPPELEQKLIDFVRHSLSP